ncbi:sulfate ABC transporter ATP-binding protein [Methylovirgula ligni]|uniref:Sulfate transport system ATP-binding protein n=1 Tax=Methylovirgula ligni TaxID=569860 RepID=A0A3D9YZ17_9HYPH|nr:TOBE-like domain-containing protein [Methylovirgula ligni]QAY97021.1 sulfate ABC transporter ATP-binding protein [Methylovirgula ligni]REF87911.1 sulfate transport system ATP-binding protein [Methylovirgula ligni]
MSIEVRKISKTYSAFQALKDVNLKVESGELVALLGPSGSGKTTLLRIIAGIEAADLGGEVLFDDVDVSDTDLGKRRIGFVFQSYALFKQMSVFENIAFGLRAKPWRERPSNAQIKAKVEELLSLVQLSNFAQRYPSQLSGGQRQRVALARALAVEPRVLLLDEPFGALDATVRRELRRWLRKLHNTIKITTILVTHDQEEALEVADRIAVMNGGHIEQFDSPEAVYERPANPFVFRFLGNYNLFHGRLAARTPVEAAPESVVAQGEKAVTFVRPHDVEISRANGGGSIAAKVTHVGFAGAAVNVELVRLDDQQLIDAELSTQTYRDLALKVEDQVFVRLRNAHSFADDYTI